MNPIIWQRGGCSTEWMQSWIQVWKVDCENAKVDVGGLAARLSEEERDRAGRFRVEDAWRSFVLCRSALRILLAPLLETSPGEIQFADVGNRKPGLLPEQNRLQLEFNVSHSGGMGLVAIARHRQIGVDVEACRAEGEWNEIADRYFAPQESAAIRRLPAEDRLEGFFRCWTRKEALLKGIGFGLLGNLQSFAVDVRGAAWEVDFSTNDTCFDRWRLFSFIPEWGYVAALAAGPGPVPEVRFRQFDWAVSAK